MLSEQKYFVLFKKIHCLTFVEKEYKWTCKLICSPRQVRLWSIIHIMHNALFTFFVSPSSKYLAKSSSEMIAVPVHEVVSVSPVFLPQLFHNLLDLMLSEVCVAEVETLLVPELLSQLPRLPGADVEYPGEGEGVTPIGVLSAVHLEARVIHPDTHGGGVVVSPEHVVYVEDNRLPGHVKDGSFLYLLS